MSAAYDLSNDEPATAAARPPQVFNRVFSVPPGAPWEQSRAAQLEVRHGSPLPIGELIWRLRRLERWGPGRIGRYAVFYIRNGEFSEAFETTIEVEGQPIRVAFGLAADQFRRARRGALAFAAAGLCAAALGVGAISALDARGRVETALSGLEHTAQVKVAMAKTVQRQRAQGRELRAAVGQAGRLEDVLADLAWASVAKAPDARISAVHWDHGLLAVEARGEASPFTGSDRPVEKAGRPVRPGTWLWGVKPRATAAGAP